MYAVFNVPGGQIKAQVGDELRLDAMPKNAGDKVTFDQVLLVSDDKNVRIGNPFVGAVVEGTVVAHERGDKVIVFKKKRRVDYHKKYGHRQQYTTVRIDAIKG